MRWMTIPVAAGWAGPHAPPTPLSLSPKAHQRRKRRGRRKKKRVREREEVEEEIRGVKVKMADSQNRAAGTAVWRRGR